MTAEGTVGAPTCFIWGQESDLSNSFIIINTEKHKARKKVKNGQKLPKTAEILYVFFNDCIGLSKVITFECLTWFDFLFLLWPYQTDISTF
jgi:hypothetical protein